MTSTTLLLAPLLLGFPISVSPQDARVPVPSHADSLDEKIAELDALIDELLEIAHGEGPDAERAFGGVMRAYHELDTEYDRWLRERQAAERAVTSTAHLQATEWTGAVSQLKDDGRRQAALAAMAAALRSGDPVQQQAACSALAQLGQVKFAKEPFRPDVLAIARNSHGELKSSALYALYNTEWHPEDLELAIELADESGQGSNRAAWHLLYLFSKGEVTGRAGEAAMKLFETDDQHAAVRAMGGLWGARVSPEIERRMLELSRAGDRDVNYNAIYFGVSTLRDKSPAVIERLIEAALETDPNYHQRALWGLGHGIQPENGHLVVSAMRDFFEARSAVYLQTKALELIGRYGSAEDAAWLEQIRSDEARPEPVRRAAGQAIDRIDR